MQEGEEADETYYFEEGEEGEGDRATKQKELEKKRTAIKKEIIELGCRYGKTPNLNLRTLWHLFRMETLIMISYI